jgi:hypothetical protein
MTPDELLMAQRRDARARAVAALGAAMDHINATGRAPDRWEYKCLWQGINAVFHGAYALAETEGCLAQVPRASRSPLGSLGGDEPSHDLASLRSALRSAEAEDVRLHPHLGPL